MNTDDLLQRSMEKSKVTLERTRQWARQKLLAGQAEGLNPHVNCLDVMGDLHNEMEPPDFTDSYVVSFLKWVFGDDPQKYEEWGRLVTHAIIDRRDWAKDQLAARLSQGHDPRTVCCETLFGLRHQSPVSGQQDESHSRDDSVECARWFLTWVFADDKAELRRWNALITPPQMAGSNAAQDDRVPHTNNEVAAEPSVFREITVDDLCGAADRILEVEYRRADSGNDDDNADVAAGVLSVERELISASLDSHFGFYSTLKWLGEAENEHSRTKPIPPDPFGYLLGIPETGDPPAPICEKREWQCAKGTILFLSDDAATSIQQIALTLMENGVSERILDDLVETLVKHVDDTQRSLEERLYWSDIHRLHGLSVKLVPVRINKQGTNDHDVEITS